MATITIDIPTPPVGFNTAYCYVYGNAASCVFLAKDAEARIDAVLDGPLANVSRHDKLEGLNAVAGADHAIDTQGVDTFVQAASAYAEAQREAAKSLSPTNKILYNLGLVVPVVDFPSIVRKIAKPTGK